MTSGRFAVRVTRLLSAASTVSAVIATLAAAPVATAAPASRSAAVTPSPTGSVSMVAGGFGHGPATSLRARPTALAYDNGTLYVGETTSTATSAQIGFVRRIDLSNGSTTIVAGGGTRSTSDLSSGIAATRFRLSRVSGLAIDGTGRLLVAGDSVFAVTESGTAAGLTLSPMSASGGTCEVCSGQPGARPTVLSPDLSIAADGSLLLANGSVFRVGSDGRTWTLVGGGATVEQAGMRENIPGAVASADAISVASDGEGGAYFVTRRSTSGAAPVVGDAVRRVLANGTVRTIAQDGTIAVSDPNMPVAAPASGLGSPLIVRTVPNGLLVATTTGVWHRSTVGAWEHLAGGGVTPPADSATAVGTSLVPTALAPDDAGGFFVSTADRVWHVDSSGVLHLVEGTGAPYGGDGGQATDATFASPSGVVRGPDGTTYVSDAAAHVIRAIAPDGRIRTLAGTGSAISSGDGGPAFDAGLGQLGGRIVTDGTGNVYLMDGNSVREIDTAGTIRTVAGNGNTTPDLSGPVTATTTSIVPTDLAAAPDGTLYIAERSRHRVRKLAPDGTLTTLLDAESTGTSLDVTGIALDGSTVYVSDAASRTIWQSVAGGAVTAYASLSNALPGQLAVDGTHHIYGLLGVLVCRINAGGGLQPVIGVSGHKVSLQFADSLESPDFPIAPIEAEAPGSIASDGVGGLLGTTGGAVFDYAGLGVGGVAPVRPHNVSVAPGNGQLAVSWSADSWPGTTPDSYTVTASPGGASLTVSGPPPNPVVLPGLVNGTTYSVTVQATNAAGTSYPSAPVTGTPRAVAPVPVAPTDVAAWAMPDGRVRVAWTAPASNGPGLGLAYRLLLPTGPSSRAQGCAAPPCSMFEDVAGPTGVATTYRVLVTSSGGSSTSDASNAVIAGTAPQAPTNLRVLPHNRTSTVVWDAAPATPGHPISAVCASTASGWGTCTSGSATAMSLPSRTPGTPEQVALQIGNDLGVISAGPVSVTSVTGAQPAAPAAASGVVASPNWHAVHVTWTPPTTGSPVRDSIVTLLPEGRSLVIAGNQHTADFTAVAPGTSHTVSVTTDGDGGVGPAAPSNQVSLPADPPGQFVPVQQARLFSVWLGYSNAPATNDDVTVANTAGIPQNAEAVLINVEVESPTQAGYLRVTPWQSTSSTAVQEFAAGQTVSNLVAVKLGPGGTIELHLSGGAATVDVDVEGAFVPTGPGDTFQPLSQARAYGPGSVTAGIDRDVVIAGHAGIPAGADAAVVNVEVQSPTKAGYLRVTPGGTTSQTAVQEFLPGRTVSNLVAVKLGPGGTIRLHLSAGTATVFVDVAGAFISNGPGDGYRPVPQARVYGPQTLAAGADRDVVIAGRGGIPANADAVMVNVEVQSPTKAGYVRVTPGGTTSQTSVQEFSAGQTISALVPVKLGLGGTIRLHLSAGTAIIFVDVAGAFTST